MMSQESPPGTPAAFLREGADLARESLELYRTHWRVLMGIVAAFAIPLELLFSLLAATQDDGALLLVLVLQMMVSPILAGAVAKAIADVRAGDAPDVGTTVNFALAHTRALLVVTALTVVAVTLGILALVVPGFILLVRLYFASVVVVLEDAAPGVALRRSFELTRDRFWWFLVAILLIGGASTVVGAALQYPLVALAPDSLAAGTVAAVLSMVLVAPFSAVASVLLFFDARSRVDGPAPRPTPPDATDA